VHIQWNFSKPDPQKTGPPWISADFLRPSRTFLCKLSLTKPATPLNRPYFLVPVLAGLEKFHCTSFSKKIFWKQIRMSLVHVLEYNWHETAVFTKHKHRILTWENSLKYSAWHLSFALWYKWCYNEKRLKSWWYPTMDIAHEIFLQN
jgi:hypothetical protein